jgi:hypothetical protein
MDDPTDATASRWSSSPTSKARTAVQRHVTLLLDELAPERVLKRVDHLKGPVEQHRTPSGCVLQAASSAVSVSWFGDPGEGSPLGELHVIVWRGTVARRGVARPGKGATIIADVVLRPIEPPEGDLVWLSKDSEKYSTSSLAAKCLALLEEQVSSGR